MLMVHGACHASMCHPAHARYGLSNRFSGLVSDLQIAERASERAWGVGILGHPEKQEVCGNQKYRIGSYRLPCP